MLKSNEAFVKKRAKKFSFVLQHVRVNHLISLSQDLYISLGLVCSMYAASIYYFIVRNKEKKPHQTAYSRIILRADRQTGLCSETLSVGWVGLPDVVFPFPLRPTIKTITRT